MGSYPISNLPVNQRRATLNDGQKIPLIGLGTYLSSPNEVTRAVIAAYVNCTLSPMHTSDLTFLAGKLDCDTLTVLSFIAYAPVHIQTLALILAE